MIIGAYRHPNIPLFRMAVDSLFSLGSYHGGDHFPLAVSINCLARCSITFSHRIRLTRDQWLCASSLRNMHRKLSKKSLLLFY
ncbi:hypothetical protein ALC57_18689 [Trachymyrmex cornetzi]|uniref:Uncharacterized protein n=1 Tax=Trachymyrmex cornetzi TaxID=471704 RepID=A0A151IRF8_9HYME|nr:hypothetical protein ALC57_18689 [Trachymyrmex cornetzi]